MEAICLGPTGQAVSAATAWGALNSTGLDCSALARAGLCSVASDVTWASQGQSPQKMGYITFWVLCLRPQVPMPVLVEWAKCSEALALAVLYVKEHHVHELRAAFCGW